MAFALCSPVVLQRNVRCMSNNVYVTMGQTHGWGVVNDLLKSWSLKASHAHARAHTHTHTHTHAHSFIVVVHAVEKLVNASEHCSPRILTVTILHCGRSHASPCGSMQPVHTISYLLSCTLCSLAVASPAGLCNVYFWRVQAARPDLACTLVQLESPHFSVRFRRVSVAVVSFSNKIPIPLFSL